jgi:hypothetical protein
MTSCGRRPSVWDREANHKLKRCWQGVYFYGWCRYGQSLYLQRNRGRWMLSNSIWMRSCTPFQAEISVDTTIMAQHHTLSPTLTHLPGLSNVPPPQFHLLQTLTLCPGHTLSFLWFYQLSTHAPHLGPINTQTETSINMTANIFWLE